ncbi:uncharacterized protein LOC132302964 [Cornus florida]|uniref:uncharacterized protein LOC132302964 n=1 Tax=Cornus florida TaxID=4283 RepID=UPI0028996460|nr:uncharacterized protein LOC132302964 [Cornus florida]
MASSNSLLFLLFLLSSSFHISLGHQIGSESVGGRREESVVAAVGERRVLMSFKETPSGGNFTFECSPSGPCVACVYSEKNDEKYRCSETGYRIPFKCVEIGAGLKEANSEKSKKSRSALENTYERAKPHVMLHVAEDLTTSIRHRSLLGEASTSGDVSQAYITYRSCIPPVNEEKISVLGFEGIMLCFLLTSGYAVYFRRKRNNAMSGVAAMRLPTSSRF